LYVLYLLGRDNDHTCELLCASDEDFCEKVRNLRHDV
jgi:hypothetical protein